MVAGVVESWSADPSQYQLLGKIGQGAFATVWKARKLSSNTQTTPNQDATSTTTVVSTADGTLATTTTTEQSHHHHHSQSQNFHYCAVKLLNLDAAATTNLADIRGEVQAMRLLSHPNVLTCYTAFVHDRNLWLVTPLMSKGSSLHCLSSARRQRRLRNRRIQQQQQNATAAVATTTVTTENERIPTATAIPMIQHILYILHETLLGLQYIHENGQQIHRDIKAGNILVDGTGGIAIADFGVSSSSSGNSKRSLLLEKAQTFVGTPCWMAPVRTNKQANEQWVVLILLLLYLV